MVDFYIWCCVCLVFGLWLGFMLCVLLTFGSLRKWKACGSAYTSGRVAALQELYRQISAWQQKTKGVEWSILNEIMDLIAAMLPGEIRKE